MPGNNFSRRVARAAASGGGRTYKSQTPVAWYLVLLVICLLGVSLIAYSRYELLHPAVAAAKPVAPPNASNEWQAAVAVDVCGTFEPSALPVDQVSTDALASLGNGMVRVEPRLASQPALYEGSKANLGAYLLIEGASISNTLLQLPGKPVPVATTTTTSVPAKAKKAKKTSATTTTTTSATTTTTTVPTRPGPARDFRNGVTKCGKKPGFTTVETWPSPTSTKGTVVPNDAADGIRFSNGQMITIAFLPKGTPVPRPPAADRSALKTFLLEDPSGIAVTSSPTGTTPTAPTTVPSTTVPSTTGPSTTVPSSSGKSTSTKTTSSAAKSTSAANARSKSSTTSSTS